MYPEPNLALTGKGILAIDQPKLGPTGPIGQWDADKRETSQRDGHVGDANNFRALQHYVEASCLLFQQI